MELCHQQAGRAEDKEQLAVHDEGSGEDKQYDGRLRKFRRRAYSTQDVLKLNHTAPVLKSHSDLLNSTTL